MFDAVFGMAIGRAIGMIEAHKRAQKPRITMANTQRATIVWPVGLLRKGLVVGAPDYIEELRTQAKWDAEKCANQQ